MSENLKDLSKEELQKVLKEKYGKVYEVEAENEDLDKTFTYYFTKPTTPSFNRALKTMSKKSLQSMKDFTMDNIVAEQKEEYQKDLEEYPALCMPLGQKLLGLLGVSDSVSIKKL